MNVSGGVAAAEGRRRWSSARVGVRPLTPTPVYCGTFHCQIVEKGLELTFLPQITIGV